PEGHADRGELAFKMKLEAEPASTDGHAPKPEVAPRLQAEPPAKETAESAEHKIAADPVSALRPHKEDALLEESCVRKTSPYHETGPQPISAAAAQAGSGGPSSGSHDSKGPGTAERLEAAPPEMPA